MQVDFCAGSYVPGQEITRIASVSPSLQVITSKQRPRKHCIRGSNGKDYMFLLKVRLVIMNLYIEPPSGYKNSRNSVNTN
jgi:hypothetical protein